MTRKLKTNLWKKAYLIEFVDENWKVLDAFTFSVPPENEEITYSQRKSETKTFGGLHVDDYGMDAVKISLSGSTVNQEVKRIYNPKGADKWMTGEQEIYYLRSLIHKYKTGNNRAKDIRIILYDLSKMNYITGGVKSGTRNEDGIQENIKNYWRVFPGDFKIRRASDRPFTYKYSIEFTAVDLEDSANWEDLLLPNGLGFAKKALEAIRKGAEWLEKGLKYIDNVNAFLENLNDSIRVVSDILDAYADVLMGYVDGANNIVDTVNEIIRIPGDLSTKVLNIGLEFFNAGKRLLESVENLFDTAMAMFDKESPYWEDTIAQADLYGMTGEEYHDLWFDMLTTMENEASAIVALSKSGNLPNPNADTGNDVSGEGGGSGGGGEGGGGGSGEGEGDDESTGDGAATAPQSSVRQSIGFSYGDTEVTLNSTDTLESLAAQYLGSPDRAIDIAVYNGVASINELNPGGTIKIPILTPSGRHSLNRIYSRPEDRDNYGRDIHLNSEGYTSASASGDYKLTEGINNLNQAILLRLRESVNKRIRLNAYGIRTNISDPTAGVAYIISSIDLTVSRDPRVSAVNNIRFTGVGDGLNITVDYTDTNHAAGNVTGRA